RNLPVKDKIVIVLRYEPKSFRKAEAGKKSNYTPHAHLVNKAINARNHGASAVVLVNAEGEKDDLIEFGRIAGPENARIPIVQVKRSVVDEWLKPVGQTLSRLQDKIESEKAPASITLPDNFKLSLQVDIERPETTVQNVLGFLPGKSKEYIVIGAHYDHIGYGQYSSMAPDQSGKVHPGADDNASGTAGLLELARIFSERRSELDRGILFAAFAGEEVGLIGSANWVEKPTLPLHNAVAMMNMDMIGRVNGAKLFVGGVGSGSTFDGILKDVLRKYDFKVEQSFKSSSSSDHASFVDKNIPSLFFFSGLHSDYHKPTDTWNKIDTAASSKVVNVVADVVSSLLPANVPRPQFVNPSRRRDADRYFGITPDYKQVSKGLRIDAIASGSPAAAAGLQSDDLIVFIDSNPINDSFDFAYALTGRKAGDVVRLQLLRNGKQVTSEVTLT
ncbi:MAG TPA: M28 family peptidase, partial [Bryobacteraceae bacterium]|nr:M28 family peptidase [Bryobacteraceae bacterium]